MTACLPKIHIHYVHYCHPPQLHFSLHNTMLLADSGVKHLTWEQTALLRCSEGMLQPSSWDTLLLAQLQSGPVRRSSSN